MIVAKVPFLAPIKRSVIGAGSPVADWKGCGAESGQTIFPARENQLEPPVVHAGPPAIEIPITKARSG